jgi:hypothetical protein
MRTNVLFVIACAIAIASCRRAPREDATPPPAIAGKRALDLDASLATKLVGKWTNDVDQLVVEITAVDLESGRLSGRATPTTGPAAANDHELVGWVSGAPPKDGYDGVIPITWSTSLYEYGTLASWSGFMRDDRIVTMHFLVWPNKPYAWDHISTFQETWTRVP